MLSGITSGSRFKARFLNQRGILLTSGGTDERSGLRTHGKSLKEKITKRKQSIRKTVY